MLVVKLMDDGFLGGRGGGRPEEILDCLRSDEAERTQLSLPADGWSDHRAATKAGARLFCGGTAVATENDIQVDDISPDPRGPLQPPVGEERDTLSEVTVGVLGRKAPWPHQSEHHRCEQQHVFTAKRNLWAALASTSPAHLRHQLAESAGPCVWPRARGECPWAWLAMGESMRLCIVRPGKVVVIKSQLPCRG